MTDAVTVAVADTVPPRPIGPVTATADRILDAARDLVLQQHPAALTIAEIARAAGVSHRTVYRYFPNKESLIRAVADRPSAHLGLSMPHRWDETRGALRVQWRILGENLDMIRSERMIPGGLELRRARLESTRPAFDRLLAEAGVPAGATRASVASVLIHLTSSSTLLELVDLHGMTVDEATEVVQDAIDRIVAGALADATQHHPGER